jgi:hypothetical protein
MRRVFWSWSKEEIGELYMLERIAMVGMDHGVGGVDGSKSVMQ